MLKEDLQLSIQAYFFPIEYGNHLRLRAKIWKKMHRVGWNGREQNLVLPSTDQTQNC